VRAVLALAQALGLPVLAEGVETEEERDFLRAVGCDEMQGYLIGRPHPIAHYAEVLGRPLISDEGQGLREKAALA
jgi:EAL domain-containing protein (putative c-di-GMP-specific phosphodiesterase class I)